MRKVLVSDIEEKKQHAGYKARYDVLNIARSMGMSIVYVSSQYNKKTINGILERISCAIRILFTLRRNDIVYVNYPNNIFYLNFLFVLKKIIGYKLTGIIHDLDSLRGVVNKDHVFVSKFDSMIVHNLRMASYIREISNVNLNKIKLLDVFDYLVDAPNNNDIIDQNSKIVFVGNLSKNKSSFIYDYDNEIDVWGMNFEINKNPYITYNGCFDPNNPTVFSNAYVGKKTFGLVWDGTSPHTCEGDFGEYLKFNNPHKASFYLSQNLPLIVWDKSAMSDFVIKNKCGIVVSSMSDIKSIIESIDNESYIVIKSNAIKIGEKIRAGYFMMNAFMEIEKEYS
ncbi:hypothetical protein V2E67_000106 [Citrobacter freundii]|nr:hypothetical protein [Citrobacter freundii]